MTFCQGVEGFLLSLLQFFKRGNSLNAYRVEMTVPLGRHSYGLVSLSSLPIPHF